MIVYSGEDDLPAFAFACSQADDVHTLSNTETYKHVTGIIEGRMKDIVWFKERYAG